VRGKPTNIDMSDLKRMCYAARMTLISDKLTALFEPCHLRQYSRISFEIKRSIGGSVATSYWIREKPIKLLYFL